MLCTLQRLSNYAAIEPLSICHITCTSINSQHTRAQMWTTAIGDPGVCQSHATSRSFAVQSRWNGSRSCLVLGVSGDANVDSILFDALLLRQ